MKAAVRSLAARAYWAAPHFLAGATGKALILTYHRVLPRTEAARTFVQAGMYVSPETFERHLKFITTRFQVLALGNLLARWERGAWDPTLRYCAITFDDGWLDNYVHAYPLLCAYAVPATIFLTTNLIGSNEWFWPDRLGYLLGRCREKRVSRRTPDAFDAVVEQAKTMSDEARDDLLRSLEETSGVRLPGSRCLLNWDEVREMSREGITFGSHTATHAILTRVDHDTLRRELRTPLEVLREQRVNHIPVLSYPNGDHADNVVAEANAAGYRAALTTLPGFESPRPADLFRLRRVGVHDDVTRSIPLLTFHIARQVRRSGWNA